MPPITQCHTQRKLSYYSEKRSAPDGDSWRPIKQPYFRRFSRSYQRDEIFLVEIKNSSNFALIVSFTMESMKNLKLTRAMNTNERNVLNFFQHFSSIPFSKNNLFLLEKYEFRITSYANYEDNKLDRRCLRR